MKLLYFYYNKIYWQLPQVRHLEHSKRSQIVEVRKSLLPSENGGAAIWYRDTKILSYAIHDCTTLDKNGSRE